ncbi:MAG: hypothetical protein FWC62_01345 [Firmicutes bacterium]|nr:hypothetical protein [Bacillota bacterium]
MSFPTLSAALDSLLALTSPAVIQRGEDYFRGGCVRALGHTPGGRFMAIVSASADSTYRVFVETRDGGNSETWDSVADFGCNCPYDAEPVCKHLVAVFRDIQAGEAVDVGEDLEGELWDWLAQGRESAERKVQLERSLRSGDIALLRACTPLATRSNVHRFYAAMETLRGPEVLQLRRELNRQVYAVSP